jgi:phosphate transport system permease protein
MTSLDTRDTRLTTAPPRTTIPVRTPPSGEQSRRRLGVLRTSDYLAVVGGLAAACTMTALLWTQFAPFTGILGYIITSWCLFVLIYGVLVSLDENRPTVRDRVAAVVVHSLGAVVLAALLWVIIYTIYKGWKALVHVNFYTQDMSSTGPLDPLTKGGIFHAILGTLIMVGIALAIAMPLGILGGIFLHEVPGPFSRFVRTVVDAMTALPDVVAGLFIYATLILILGMGFSGFAAGTALAITALPIIMRATDVVLRLVPGSLTEASYALGSGQWRTVRSVVLPTARSGLATAVILGAARAVGETAPVLLTAGFTAAVNTDPFHGPMMSLPLFAYTSVQASEPNPIARGFGAAATLLILVLLLFAIARVIGGRGPGQLTRRQRRRRAAASQRDLKRYLARQAASAVEGGA